MNIGTLTSFFTLNVLLGRGSVIVGDWLILFRILLLLFTILIGLSKGSIDTGSKSFI